MLGLQVGSSWVGSISPLATRRCFPGPFPPRFLHLGELDQLVIKDVPKLLTPPRTRPWARPVSLCFSERPSRAAGLVADQRRLGVGGGGPLGPGLGSHLVQGLRTGVSQKRGGHQSSKAAEGVEGSQGSGRSGHGPSLGVETGHTGSVES